MLPQTPFPFDYCIASTGDRPRQYACTSVSSVPMTPKHLTSSSPNTSQKLVARIAGLFREGPFAGLLVQTLTTLTSAPAQA